MHWPEVKLNFKLAALGATIDLHADWAVKLQIPIWFPALVRAPTTKQMSTKVPTFPTAQKHSLLDM